MIRSIGILLVLGMALIGITTVAWCVDPDAVTDDENTRVFEGTVARVDRAAGTLTVQGAEEITFPITADTILHCDDDDSAVKLSDINPGDYVTVEYYRKGMDSLAPARVTNVTLEYRRGDDAPWKKE